jgi:hypothetical protein
MTKEQARYYRQRAAHTKIGAKYTYYPELIKLFAGPVVKLVVLVVAGAGLMWVWFHVPHRTLGLAAIAAACLIAVSSVAYAQSDRAVQRRVGAAARNGGTVKGAGLGWAVAGLCALLVIVSWLSLGSQWA